MTPGLPVIAGLICLTVFTTMKWPERWDRPRPDDNNGKERTK